MERERSAATAMLGLSGFVVLGVSEDGGEVEQAVEITAGLVGCPECGAVVELHDRRPCWVRDLPSGGRPVALVWVKRVWRCPHALCPRRPWTKTAPGIAPDIPELTRPARTVDSWRTELLAYFDTDGISNGPHRSDQPADQENQASRTRIPQLRQLPAPPPAALRRRLGHCPSHPDQRPATTLSGVEPISDIVRQRLHHLASGAHGPSERRC